MVLDEGLPAQNARIRHPPRGCLMQGAKRVHLRPPVAWVGAVGVVGDGGGPARGSDCFMG
eukprot:13473194-Alexandrium_andersonii.AAC.1